MSFGRVVDEELEIAHLGALLFTVPTTPLQDLFNEHRGLPAESSTASREHELFDVAPLASATTLAALWLFDSCAQYFDVLDSILSTDGGRRVGLRPTIRAVIEHSALSAWLMDPRIGGPQRAARALLCEAVSADQLAQAMKHEGGQALVDAEKRLEWAESRVRGFFPDGIERSERAPHQHSSWRLGNETYGGITRRVEELVARRRGGPNGEPSKRGRAVSMFIATVTHPSSAGALMHAARDAHGAVTLPRQDLSSMRSLVHSALATWTWAVDDLLMLHGWQCSQFREWESRLPSDARSVRR